MKRTDRHRSRIPFAAVAGVPLLVSALAACASTPGPRDVESELAQLRREHEMMRAELESLRRQLAPNGNLGEPSPGANVPIAPGDDSPGRTLTLVLEIYRESLEAGDLDRLRSAVIGGETPPDDIRLLEKIVERTQGLKLDLATRKLDLQGHRARLVVDHTMDFRLRLTQEQRRARLAFVMLFEEGPEGWRLVGIHRD